VIKRLKTMQNKCPILMRYAAMTADLIIYVKYKAVAYSFPWLFGRITKTGTGIASLNSNNSENKYNAHE
jgi:hypothetical protein